MTKSTVLYVITQEEFHLSCDGEIGREERERERVRNSPLFLFADKFSILF